MKRYRRASVWLTISTVLLLIDIASKKWAEAVLAPLKTLPLFDGLIGLRYAKNTGAAFSAFSDSTPLLSAVSLIVCAAILIYMLLHPDMDWLTGISVSMMLSGGIGNLIDRLTRGYVVDFFEFQFVNFAIFNVADICITAGTALLFAALLRGGDKNDRMEN